MSWWPLFKEEETDVDVVKRQLAPCLLTIIQNRVVADDFVNFHGDLVGPPSTEHAQKFLDFVGDRMTDDDFVRRIRQALDIKQLRGILNLDSTGNFLLYSSNRGPLDPTVDAAPEASLEEGEPQEGTHANVGSDVGQTLDEGDYRYRMDNQGSYNDEDDEPVRKIEITVEQEVTIS